MACLLSFDAVAIYQCTRRHGYLSALEQQEHLPLFWAEEERSLLQGTEVEHRPQEDEELTQEDFETNVRPLVEHADRLKPDAFTLDTFRTAASWVASRAFGVDSFHGALLIHHHQCTAPIDWHLSCTPAFYWKIDYTQDLMLVVSVQECRWCHWRTFSITRPPLSSFLMSISLNPPAMNKTTPVKMTIPLHQVSPHPTTLIASFGILTAIIMQDIVPYPSGLLGLKFTPRQFCV